MCPSGWKAGGGFRYNASMRNVKLVIVLTGLMLSAVSWGAPASFLFIGNSQTDANYLPELFEALAEAGGHSVHVDRSAVGGASVSYHTHHQATLDLIAERTWDHVVLQEHTLVPVIEYWRENSFYPSVARMDSIVTVSGSSATLFLHWAYPEPVGEYCILDYCSREFSDYFDMQSEMSSAYYPLATELDMPLVPVGDVWADALAIEPSLPLWGSDQMHTSAEGAYFTACIFYRFFFGESPLGLPYYGNLDEATASQYQQLVDVVTGVPEPVPTSSATLFPAAPNPCNPGTMISFELARAGAARLSVHAADGRLVATLVDRRLEAGLQRVIWDGYDRMGRRVPSGTYFYQLQAAGEQLGGRVSVVR